jgi:hypothetical protein
MFTRAIKVLPKMFPYFPLKRFEQKGIFYLPKFNFKIYTKTGDKGTTSILGGKRLAKDDLIFDLLGDIDEFNSQLGLVKIC